MNGRGVKQGNGYIGSYGKMYDKTPKAVFAAMALSFAYIDVEERGFDVAVTRVLEEWRCLYENGIVPQKPPKEAYGKE